MISSPSLRSVPTVNSAESVSPRAGSLLCENAGAQAPGPVSVSAKASAAATPRRPKVRRVAPLAPAREGEDMGRRRVEAGRRTRSAAPGSYDATETFPVCNDPFRALQPAQPFRRAGPGAHGRRGRQDRHAPRRARQRRHPHAAGDPGADRVGQRGEGRRARHRPHRRDPGRQAHLGAGPALPSDRDHPDRGRVRDRARERRGAVHGPGRDASARPASRWRRSPPCRSAC